MMGYDVLPPYRIDRGKRNNWQTTTQAMNENVRQAELDRHKPAVKPKVDSNNRKH